MPKDLRKLIERHHIEVKDWQFDIKWTENGLRRVQEGTLPRRYGGDKLGFDQGEVGTGYCPEDERRIRLIRAVIDRHRAVKRLKKLWIETQKEEEIDTASRERVGKSPLDVKGKKRILQIYHSLVLWNAGWSLRELVDELTERLGEGIAFEDGAMDWENGYVLVRCKAASHLLYTVYVGQGRFPVIPTAGPDPASLPQHLQGADSRIVYVKIGHEDADEDQLVKKKHFVLDSNGVMTHRYVTRAFLVYNLATMFGLRLAPPGTEPDQRDEQLSRFLQSETAGRICRTTTRIENPLVATVDGLQEQQARYTGSAFGGHAEVFDIRRAASYEPDGLLNPDFTPYRSRGSTGSKFMSRIGYTLVNGSCDARSASDPMMRNERASMQVRNGSGPHQPYLSTAALLSEYKIIRANKGERFDDSAENLGVVLVDLSIAKLMGAEIINQHAVESDRFKIAYDRYVDRGDVVALERTVATKLIELASRKELRNLVGKALEPTDHRYGKLRELADALTRQASAPTPTKGVLESLAGLLADCGVRPADLGINVADQDLAKSDGALKCIMALRGDWFDNKSIIKRSAAAELEEYIASARKNREVLLNRIPLACVVGIKLNRADGKWMGLDADDFPILHAGSSKGWIPFNDDVRRELLAYVTGDRDHGYSRMRDMFRHAVALKRQEDLAGEKDNS